MSTLTTINATDVPSTSRTVINNNFSALNTEKIETSVLDTDTTLAANSDAKIASQKAVKAYVDAGTGVSASSTVKGVVEEATQGEVDAGTAAGGTGARLFVNPSTINAAFALLTTAQTLTSKRITLRAPTITQSATPAINTDLTDVAHIVGLAQAITSMTSSLTGTPVQGDELRINFTDNGTGRAITWGASFEASTVALPTTTIANARLDVKFHWNTVTSKWRCVQVA